MASRAAGEGLDGSNIGKTLAISLAPPLSSYRSVISTCQAPPLRVYLICSLILDGIIMCTTTTHYYPSLPSACHSSFKSNTLRRAADFFRRAEVVFILMTKSSKRTHTHNRGNSRKKQMSLPFFRQQIQSLRLKALRVPAMKKISLMSL